LLEFIAPWTLEACLKSPSKYLKKLKPWKLPKIKGFILKFRVPPLWPSYITESRTTFGKTYGIGAMENTLETWGIYWEPEENPLGT